MGDLNVGAGVMPDIADMLSRSGESERCRDIDADDQDLASINLSYRFGN